MIVGNKWIFNPWNMREFLFLFVLLSFFTNFSEGSCTDGPGVKILSTKAQNNTHVQVLYSLENSVSAYVGCVARSRQESEIPGATEVLSEAQQYGQNSTTQSQITIQHFPAEGYCFPGGAFFCVYRVFCAARDATSGDTSSEACVNASSILVQTSGVGSDLIQVDVVDDTTTEYGGFAVFHFGLVHTVSPGAEILLTIDSQDHSEGLASNKPQYVSAPAFYSFTESNFSAGAYATGFMIGQEDSLYDPDTIYHGVVKLYSQDDERYDYVPEGLFASFELTNLEADGAATDHFLDEVGLEVKTERNFTEEDDGTPQVLFSVQLLGKPTGSVTLTIFSDDGTEAVMAYPSLLVFDSDNWNISQQVFAMGVEDRRIDRYDAHFAVLDSEDARYEAAYALYHFSLGTSTYEKAAPAVTLGAGNCSMGVTEGAEPCAVNLTFCHYPLVNDVCKPLSVKDLYYDMGYSKVEIVISTSNKTAATMTAAGEASTVYVLSVDEGSSNTDGIVRWIPVYPADDVIIDGSQNFSVSIDLITVYDIDTGLGEDLSTAHVLHSPIFSTTLDNDVAEVILDYRACLYPQTSEGGRSCHTQVQLASRPREAVTFTVFLNDNTYAVVMLLEDGTEDITTEITIQPSEWATPISIDFVGQDSDNIANDFFAAYAIKISSLTSDDEDFNGLPPKNYTFYHLDNDQKGLAFNYSGDLAVDEFGLFVEIKVTLDSDPSGDVYVPISTMQTHELSLSLSAIFFLEGSYSTMAASGFGGICDDGEYLDCAGNCLTTEDCELTSSGYSSCSDWLGSTCYSGETESDSGALPDFSCSLYAFGDGACSSTWDLTIDGVVYTSATSYAVLNATGLDDAVQDGNKATSIKFGPILSDDDQFNKTEMFLDLTNYDNDIATMEVWDCDVSEEDPEQGCTYTIKVVLDCPHFNGLSFISTNGDPTEAKISPSTSFLTTSGTYDVYLKGKDDMLDDADIEFTVSFELVLNLTHFGKAFTQELVSNSITVVNADNETAGIIFYQGNASWTSWKAWRDATDLSADDAVALAEILLPERTTYESSRSKQITLNFTMLSEPTAPVFVTVYTRASNGYGGNLRYEGIPMTTTATQPNPYSYTTESISVLGTWISNIDTVDSFGSALYFEANVSNWAVLHDIIVVGLDDAVDDYDMNYDLFFTASSDDPAYDQVEIIFPLVNIDDDQKGVNLFTPLGLDQCSEPDLGLTAEMGIYLNSEPKEAVVLVLSSNMPVEASPVTTIVAFNNLNWNTIQMVEISSNDDEFEDGAVDFNVTAQVLFSKDPDYGSAEVNGDGEMGLKGVLFQLPYVSLDDLYDKSAQACQAGFFGIYPECVGCKPGFYSEESGDTLACRACPPGTFGVISYGSALQESTNWIGETTDPGCMPCPAGTYQPEFGATACLECPFDQEVYCGLATTFPLATSVDYNNSEDTTVHGWELIVEDVYFGTVTALGRTYVLNEEQYKVFLLSIGCICIALFCLALNLLITKVHSKHFDKLAQMLKKLDKFVDEHLDIYGKEDGQIVGGIATIGAFIVIVMLSSMIIFIYANYNIAVSQGVVPMDDSFTRTISSSVSIEVEFVGFTGCVDNEADLNFDGVDETDVGITLKNFNELENKFYCDSGSLIIQLEGEISSISDTVSVGFELVPVCETCISSPVCQNCTIAAVQAIKWSTRADSVYPGDDNSIVGTIFADPDHLFRGGTETDLEINLVPSYYRNEIEVLSITGFRLQHQGTVRGDMATFTTYSWDPPSENILENYIVNNEFTDVSTENKVAFSINFILASWQLNMHVDTKQTWMDAWGILGGLVGSVAGMAIYIMLHFESFSDHESKHAKITTKVISCFKRINPAMRKGYFHDSRLDEGRVKSWSKTEESKSAPLSPKAKVQKNSQRFSVSDAMQQASAAAKTSRKGLAGLFPKKKDLWSVEHSPYSPSNRKRDRMTSEASDVMPAFSASGRKNKSTSDNADKDLIPERPRNASIDASHEQIALTLFNEQNVGEVLEQKEDERPDPGLIPRPTRRKDTGLQGPKKTSSSGSSSGGGEESNSDI
eukprot:CAMPEP_0117817668 /NCGR_PEP_ID=MMETSP0949-20121206/790_1 /TAXON_ID=44440 /ORGANISM="Chattonella subsalsa, Strain CCMP2191" /LENGTH=2045 /DNA_ID=CAMNT_0005656037 /DNA_START=66 /DNA_END=6203 /DNA_ORIENTATION=+